MLNQEEIDHQLKLLEAHRRTLAHSLRQHKALGVLAPPALTNGIYEAWTSVEQLKAHLRASGIEIPDEPDDQPRELTITIPSLSPTERRNRSRMLQKVRDFWIKGVLENSLHSAALIELGLEHQPDAIQHPWDMVIQQTDQPATANPPGQKSIDVFDAFGGELLILGAAGSGKTTLLLELARSLIARAEQDETYPIPVVFNLSSWAEKRKPLVEWLIEELNTKYDVPRQIGSAWATTDNVLPLLDGLDEVNLEHRNACAEAINTFRQHYGLVHLVVCSRVADYARLTAKLKLQGAVLVQPLTPEQIDAYLAQFTTDLGVLRTLLHEDATLQELVQTPLMLGIMALTFAGTSIDALTASSTVEQQRTRLFHAYVQRMIGRRGFITRYAPKQTMHWLAWLARGMVCQGQPIFLIERLQPDWLATRAHKRWYTTIDRASTALIGALLVSIVTLRLAWSTDWLLLLPAALIGGLFGGHGTTSTRTPQVFGRLMIVVLGAALTVSLIYGIVYGVDHWLAAQQHLPEGAQLAPTVPAGFDPVWEPAFLGLYAALSTMLVGGVAGLLGGLPSLQPRRIAIVEQLGWNWGKAVRTASIGILAGLTIIVLTDLLRISIGGLVIYLPRYFWGGWLVPALVLGLIFGVVGGLVGGEIGTNTRPNQGIRRSVRNALLIGPLVIVSLEMLVNMMSLIGWYTWLTIIDRVLYGLMVGLALGGYAALSHFGLRIVLWRSGAMPWNYTRFLDYCAERIFLHKVGGGYIFIHRLLMEYFAALDDAQIKELAARATKGNNR